MKSKYISLLGVIMLALVQIYVPAKMILNREAVLTSGKAYKFKTAPIDPNDPFRGKYITLNYQNNRFAVPDATDWKMNEVIYVHLTGDAKGYAKIKEVSKEKPGKAVEYIKAKVAYISHVDQQDLIFIDYPFDRYYMEESKAPAAELAYTESLQDTTAVTYALVNIKDGDAVLKDILINEVSIKDKVKASRRQL